MTGEIWFEQKINDTVGQIPAATKHDDYPIVYRVVTIPGGLYSRISGCHPGKPRRFQELKLSEMRNKNIPLPKNFDPQNHWL